MRRVEPASRASLAIGLVTLGLLASIASLGFFISDEATLTVAAYDLYGGDVRGDFPTEYFQLKLGAWPVDGVAVIGDTAYTTESRALAAISFPAYAMLRAIDVIAPAAILVVAMATVGFAGGAYLYAGERARPWVKRAVAAGAAIFFVANAFTVPRVAPVWLVPLAMQLTMIVLAAASIGALHFFVTRRSGPQEARVASAIMLAGTPFMFWAFGEKYHGLMLVLLVGVLVLRFTPGASLRSHALAWTCAGAAIWVHPKVGALVMGSLLSIEVAAFVRRRPLRRPEVKRALALGLGLAVGFAPLVVESMLLYHEPLVLGALVAVRAPPTTSAGGLSSPSAGEGGGEGGGMTPPPVEPVLVWPRWMDVVVLALRAHTVLGDLGSLPGALWATWIGPELVTADITVHLGILMVAPILVAAPFGLVGRRRRWDGADAFLALHFLALVFVYGLTAARATTGGYESRYMYVAYPALALWAAAWFAPRLAAVGSGGMGRPLAMAAGLLLVVLAVMGSARPDYTRDFFVLRRLGHLCAILVLAGCVVGVAVRRVPRLKAATPLLDPTVLTLAFVPSLLFLVQYVLHYPPRLAIDAASGGDVDLLLPLAGGLRQLLDTWIGA